MTAAPRQLVFDLPHRQALGVEDFLVSRSNAAAVEMIDRWPDWPHPATLVVGPQGSGKTHLANVWRLRSAARRRSRPHRSMTGRRRADRRRGALAVEDIDRGIADERVLFHLLNLRAREASSRAVTSRLPPGELEIALPDLRSRLRALPLVASRRRTRRC